MAFMVRGMSEMFQVTFPLSHPQAQSQKPKAFFEHFECRQPRNGI